MAKKQQAAELHQYFILDKNMTQVGGKRFAKGTKSVDLTHQEAEFFVASGSLSLEAPADMKGAQAQAAVQTQTDPPAALTKASTTTTAPKGR